MFALTHLRAHVRTLRLRRMAIKIISDGIQTLNYMHSLRMTSNL